MCSSCLVVGVRRCRLLLFCGYFVPLFLPRHFCGYIMHFYTTCTDNAMYYGA